MKLVRSVGILSFCGAIASAHALSVVTQRSQISATDTLTWGQFGVTGTSVPNSSLGTTTSGALFAVSSTDPMNRVDQGAGWQGNFNPGDQLMYTRGGTLTLDFAQTYAAFGLQIQSNVLVPFTATVSAYDGLGHLLGTFSENGTSNRNNDGSAIFLGVSSGVNDIAEVNYSVSTPFGNDFAVNYATIQSCPTPEPSTILAMAPAAAGLLGLRRRRKS